MRADGRRILASDETRTTRRANRRMREAMRVTRPLASEAIHVRGDGLLVAVTTELRPHVFAEDPDDIRLLGGVK